jgi:hypothetical protein
MLLAQDRLIEKVLNGEVLLSAAGHSRLFGSHNEPPVAGGSGPSAQPSANSYQHCKAPTSWCLSAP